jgi:tetratricopeptide (TPR) repeat protein
MAKRGLLRKQKAESTSQSSNLDRLKSQFQALIQQKSYRQALEKAKLIGKMHPEAEISPSESELWVWRGKQEYSQGQYRQAEGSFRQALEIGLQGETHYWLAKSLLALGDADGALALLRGAFDKKVLTKDYTGCYLKLLFLKGEIKEVSELLTAQTRRFSASQIHWAKGVLSLEAGKPEEAIAHFQKMGGNATPGDSPKAWIAYVQQQCGNWSQSEAILGMQKGVGFRRIGLSPALPKHPALQRLSLVQAISQRGSDIETNSIEAQQGTNRTLALVLTSLHLLETSNYHDAAHALLKLGNPCRDFPEADVLYRPAMILGAEQALRSGELDCAAAFLEAIVYQPPFDAQVAIKLYQVYQSAEYSIQSVQRLLNRLIEGVKKEAVDHPQAWSGSCLNSTLSHIHCWLADAWIGRNHHKQGFKALQTAEQLCPDSAEVMGRQGLKAYVQGQSEQSTQLLTKALEGGCQYIEVYERLLEKKERQGDRQGVKEIRRLFGKRFGDLNAETEVEIPHWVEALSTQDYWLFEELLDATREKDPALKACQIFVKAVEGEPTGSGRVALNQDRARRDWEVLLQKLSPPEQIPVLQAIFLSIQLFVKRQKGITGVQTEYLQRLLGLAGEYAEAKEAYLALLVVKGEPMSKWETALREYLNSSAQPGTALAQVQLKARRFVESGLLRPMLDEALRREPQNPQLMLAKATTYKSESQSYRTFQEEGFELARRLQDTAALQAYREEESYQAEAMTAEFMPDFVDFMNPNEPDLKNMIRGMARKMFGNEVPPEVLEMMLPILMQRLEAEMSGFGDEAEDFIDEADIFGRGFFGKGIPFGPPPSRTKKKAPKRGNRFQI